MADLKGKKSRKKNVYITDTGRVYIKATFNNLMISITNHLGDVVVWSSAGKMDFRGSKKSTPYAAQVTANTCAREAYELGIRRVHVYVHGPGAGRESAIRTLQTVGIEVVTISDVTPLPHNGCRPPKRRRV